MGVNNPEPAYFWDPTLGVIGGWRKAVVGEPGEYVWNNTTNEWVKGAIGAEYVWNDATSAWDFGALGGMYKWSGATLAWSKVTEAGGGGPYYFDETSQSWLPNTSTAITQERITDAGDTRITDAGLVRVTDAA